MTPIQKRQRLTQAMTPLVGLPQFGDFMELIGELRDGAVERAVMPETLKNQRMTLASAGEVRAYLDILSIYQSHRDAAFEREAARAVQAGAED